MMKHSLFPLKVPSNSDAKATRIQRKATNSAALDSVPPIVNDVLASSGRPLDTTTRNFMEDRFGHDFSEVRVHTDSRAAESAQAVSAKAYTVGQNVVFGQGFYSPATTEGTRLFAHELAHVVQQSGGGIAQSSYANYSFESQADEIAQRITSGGKVPKISSGHGQMVARQATANAPPQPTYTKDISKLDVAALEAEAFSLSAWFSNHMVDEANYSTKLQEAVDIFVEISARSGSPAKAADIEALKARFVARSPRTAFELRLRRGEFPAYKPVYDKGEVVGYSRSSGGYSEAVDLDGKVVWSDEIPLETPLLDPIDLIPFELVGSLAAKAASIGFRAIAKAGVKILAKDVGKVVVEEGVKLGTKEAVGEVGKLGAQKLPGAVAKKATGGVTKAVVGDLSKSSLDALVQVFRKGEKLKSVGAVSLKRLRNVLGRAGVSPSEYKLVKVSKPVAEAMEKEVGEPIWGWVQRTGSEIVKDARGRPIINFTPRALASLKEAVKTFGHEAKHLKDFAAGLTTSSEALAEKEGEKLWLVVLESLGGK